MATFTKKFFDLVCCAALIVGAGCDAPDHSPDEDLEWAEDLERDEDLMTPGNGVELIVEVDVLMAPDATYATCPDPEAEGVTYLSKDREKCAQISIVCAPGWVPIPSECGCGCMKLAGN